MLKLRVMGTTGEIKRFYKIIGRDKRFTIENRSEPLQCKGTTRYFGFLKHHTRICMNVLVIDGQGGGLGKQLVSAIKGIDGINVTAVGTNSIATSAMLKAGATEAATGENAVIVACRKADVILGPSG